MGGQKRSRKAAGHELTSSQRSCFKTPGLRAGTTLSISSFVVCPTRSCSIPAKMVCTRCAKIAETTRSAAASRASVRIKPNPRRRAGCEVCRRQCPTVAGKCLAISMPLVQPSSPATLSAGQGRNPRLLGRLKKVSLSHEGRLGNSGHRFPSE